MIPAPKTMLLISPASTTNAGTASGSIDTKGFDFAVIDVIASASDAVSNNFSVLTLSEGDTTSAYTAISTGDTDFTIANAETAGHVVAQFRVDLRARKRYLKLAASPVTTQIIAATANLFRGDELPVTATKAGAGVLVDV